MVHSSHGALAFWLLGDVPMTVVGELARRVGHALSCPVVIQPGRLDPQLSERRAWNGRSGTVVLNQLVRRQQPGCLTNVAIVADNIVSCAEESFLFGYAYVDLAAACMSMEPLLGDDPDSERLMQRAKSICLHEIGHTLGLDDHTYSSGAGCCMAGEVSEDCLELVDAFPSDFCHDCLQQAKLKLQEFGRTIGKNRFIPEERATFAGRYEIRSFVGQGGMGTVWRARDLQMNQDVALKFVVSAHFDGRSEVLLVTEAARARHLSHPNIVRVFDLVRDAGAGCLVMDWIEGADLKTVMSSQPSGCFDVPQVSRWTAQLCSAIGAAHLKGVIHQDIKPQNCLIDQEGNLIVTDFGLARLQEYAPGETPLVRTGGGGTPGFSAPEQLAGAAPHASQDIYALGATVYCLLTGHPPRVAVNLGRHGLVYSLDRINEVRRVGGKAKPNVPENWDATVAECLSIDPAKRPKSAGEVAQLLGVAHRPMQVPAGAPSGLGRLLANAFRGLFQGR